jgi:DNA-binding NtrC family response regulator
MDAMQDTVLVVEDEADIVALLRYNLSKAGFCVLIARRWDYSPLKSSERIVPSLSSSTSCFRIWMDTSSAKR